MELQKNSNRPIQEGDRNPNNPNQFRRQFAPRFIPKERRNNDIQWERREVEDENVPPPLQNNVIDEGEIEEEELFEDPDQDMNYFGEQLTEGFVTEEDFLNSEYYDADVFQTEDDLNLEVTSDIYNSNPKKTLNLILGPKQVVQNPKKKAILPPKQQSDPVLEKNRIMINQRRLLKLKKWIIICRILISKMNCAKLKSPCLSLSW